MYTLRVRRDAERGALLVEALVALLLFLLASLVLYSLLGTARSAETRSRETLAAQAVCRQLLETARALGPDGLALGEESGTVGFESQREGFRAGNRPLQGAIQFDFVRTVRPVPGTELKSVVVEVTWARGRTEMETYVGSF